MQLSYEKYENSEIETILRDLSIAEKLDIKDLITTHKKSKKKSKIKNKIKDIIDKNNKQIAENKIMADNERLNYFKHLKNINKTTINEISNFTTEYGKTRMKLKLLKIAFKKNLNKHVIDLYLQIISTQITYTKKEKKLMDKVTKYMKTIKYKEMQFKELSNQLAPLDFYNTYKLELDSWQIKVIKKIDDNKSVLVSAPTSCGKTWLSLYPGLIGKKILFIVPTEALIFQVGSMFSKFIAQPTLIGDNILYITDNNIVIGTPKAIEDKIPVLDIDFDIIIVDEIHNLGSLNSHHYYERLLKLYSDKQLLALSATIKNPRNLISWLNKVGYKNLDLIVYNTRFLNLQRQLFINNKLEKIHPIACLDLEDIREEFLNEYMSMTPYDSIVLYESLSKKIPKEMRDLDLAKLFTENNRRLSLDDARHYEKLLKKKLVYLKNKYPVKMQEILDEYSIKNNISGDVNLYNLFKEIKKKNLTPCIVFQENTNYCKEIFIKLVGYLEKLEELNYPFYYINLEFKQEQYMDSNKEINKFRKSIKLENKVLNKTSIIEDKIKTKKEQLDSEFIKKYKSRIRKQIQSISKSDIKDKIKNIQISNLQYELDNVDKYLKLQFVDIFKKHPEFSLSTDSPMTAEKIREIKKTVSKKLEIDVSYTNVFLQGLKRGIGIYTKHMPPVYNMIVQKLAQNGELGFVVADEQLALGINMPFRSSCILGYKKSNNFKKSNYLQMIGRAGRRGKDCEGHIIFANVDWKNLMKTELDEIKSKYIHLPTYKVLNCFTDKYDVDSIFKSRMTNKEDNNEIINEFFSCRVLNSIVWKLRHYNQKPINFCRHLDKIEMDLNKSKSTDSIKLVIKQVCFYFLTNETQTLLIDIIKKNKINNVVDNKEVHRIIYIIINIHNSLLNLPGEYNNIIRHYSYTFYFIKRLLNTSNNLN